MKLMKEIRRKVPKVDPIPTREEHPNTLDKDPDQQSIPFSQMARTYGLYPLTSLDLTEAYLGSKMTIPIRQCMNSVSRKNPIRRTRETKAQSHKDSPFPKPVPQRTTRKTKWPKSWTQTLSLFSYLERRILSSQQNLHLEMRMKKKAMNQMTV